MELTNEFGVPVPVDDAWAILTDVERIAPCMPGATLETSDGDEFSGNVKVKVGPLTAQYKGKARFLERDEASRRVVLRAEGRETRGQGTAAATVTAIIRPDGTGSVVTVTTDLTITGKVAQFGRGVLADVSARLLGQFVQRLEQDLEASGETEVASSAESAAAPARSAPVAAEPVDLIDAAFIPLAKRAAPLLVVVLVLLWLVLAR